MLANNPAFPTQIERQNSLGVRVEYLPGMSKREYFAVHLMNNLRGSSTQGSDWLAEIAVKDADALIKALGEPNV